VEPRAALGNGRGDRPDGASPAGGLSCRRSLRCGLLGEYLDEAIKLIVCHHEQKQA